MTHLQWKPESHLLHHADTKPREIPVKLMVFLWISNSEAEQKQISKKLTGDHVILI